MRKGKAIALFMLFTAPWLAFSNHLLPEQIQPFLLRSRLRLLTINVWSGLDYKGTMRFGTYESCQKRRARYDSLLAQIRELDPDVVFLQEANPAAAFSARLARDLGFSHCHQVCIGGIKLGPFGIPANCKEGNAILARKSLRLQKLEDWKLSGSFGLFGDVLTVHFDQAIFALWARIFVNDRPVYLVNVHLVAVPPADPALAADWEVLRLQKNMPEKEYLEALRQWQRNKDRQKMEVGKLVAHLQKLAPAIPMIVGGDFNIPDTSPSIAAFQAEAGLGDTFRPEADSEKNSWDGRENRNVLFSSSRTDRLGAPLHGYELLTALYDSRPRRIDYLFHSRHFLAADVRKGRIVLNHELEGAQASDHFGVLAELEIGNALHAVPGSGGAAVPKPEKGRIDPFPIVSYDSDIGFGYGAKIFLLNQLKAGESFDLTLFHSSKGERWYRFVFSLPDFELRQGKVYPLALDLVIDYDKYIKNNFFGIGNESEYGDREIYTREPLDIDLTLSRGFSRRLVGQLGFRYKTVRNFNFSTGSRLRELPPGLNTGRADYASVFSNWRFDSRDSYINPASGLVLQGELEWAPRSGLGNVAFVRSSFWVQAYTTLFFPKTVLALRLGAQELFGKDLPVQVLLPLGGNTSLRGSPQDRYLGKSAVLANAELRFPLFWRLGGVLGLDAGKVWSSLADADFRGWAVNPSVGLRFIMNTFVVRLDVGFGKDYTGVYFNFGHLF